MRRPRILFLPVTHESNSLAILGLLGGVTSGPKHVITSSIEHPSVLEVFRQLECDGVAVTFLPVDAGGVIRAEAVAQALRPDTVLVSVMHANNETGAIQPIQEIAKVIHGRKIYLHADGVQAFGKLAVDMQTLGVDLYSVSAHKIFGPKGIGGLYVRKGTPLRRTMLGGHHQRERRAGTENVPATMAFAQAVELCTEPDCILRDRFEEKLLRALHLGRALCWKQFLVYLFPSKATCALDFRQISPSQDLTNRRERLNCTASISQRVRAELSQ